MSDFRVTIKGIDRQRSALATLRSNGLARHITAAMKRAADRVVVPAVKSEARTASTYRHNPASPPGKRGRRGPLARNVTSRRASARWKRDPREIAAYTVAPRAWYRHFVIQGTQRHSVRRGARVRRPATQLPPFHPGARSNDIIGRATRNIEGRLTAELAEALLRPYRARIRA